MSSLIVPLPFFFCPTDVSGCFVGLRGRVLAETIRHGPFGVVSFFCFLFRQSLYGGFSVDLERCLTPFGLSGSQTRTPIRPTMEA